MTHTNKYTVVLDKEAVEYASNAYGYTPASETTFQFDLRNLLEFMATFATEMTLCKAGLDYSELKITDQTIDLTGLFANPNIPREQQEQERYQRTQKRAVPGTYHHGIQYYT